MKILFMKGLPLLVLLCLAVPALAAESPGASATNGQDGKAAAGKAENKPSDESGSGEDKGASATGEKKKNPGEYSCQFYTVNLPDNWQAVIPPTEQQGLVNAIFAAKDRNPSITILVGKNGGADAKTIAGMFAEQFKSPKEPAGKNNQYSFQFPQHDGLTAQAIVTSADKEFMVVTITGSMREARKFLRDSVKSEDYKTLLPQF